MRKILSVIVLCLVIVNSYSQNTQNADSAYSRPLINVLQDIEKQFDIKIKYDQKLIEGKVLNYADWRIKPWSASESLYSVLAPFDYTFVMDNGKFKIKQFEYARNNVEFGKNMLEYLNTLYDDKTSWEKRKTELKACLPQALGLVSIPARPNSAIILTPKRKYKGYTVENFAIETLPGVYVCGSIYMPAKMKGKCPVMLNPNGHFGQGRYREDQQKRCATLAKMGVIAVDWDLFAWGESLLQFDGTMHRMSAANMIQTLNAARVLDYVLTLKYADPERVGITGGSGGGSLTMMMAAIDDRIKLSIPTVMTSSHFVGGCPCESGLPAHLCGNRTNNAEIAAMTAPRPMLILSDGKDWTNTVPELEMPYIQRIYDFYGVGNMVENKHFPTEGHDYGLSKRKAMYDFVAQKFNLDIENLRNENGEFSEEEVTIEPEEMMYAFGKNGEKLPTNAIKGKDALIEVLKKVRFYD